MGRGRKEKVLVLGIMKRSDMKGDREQQIFKNPRACPPEEGKISLTQTPEQEQGKLTKAGMPNFLQPSINSLFPSQFEVMNTTSAFHSL